MRCKTIAERKEAFNNAEPFHFFVIDNFLEPKLALDLSKTFPSLDQMNVNYKGLNEQKSEHSEFDGFPEFTELKKILSCRQITTAIEAITQIENT